MKRTNEIRERIMTYIIAFKAEHDGIAPTIREIAAELDIQTSSAAYHVNRLVGDGSLELVRDDAGRAAPRGIMVRGGTWTP